MSEDSIKTLLRAVLPMANNPIRHYVTPGLTSSLVGGPFKGKVRLFSSDRDTMDWIAPHSHRFDFTCLVLAGEVVNIKFEASYSAGNDFCPGKLTANGIGVYEFASSLKRQSYQSSSARYSAGETYSMLAKEIHSIRFTRGAQVLFFEGPEVTNESTVLEPWSNGAPVHTFQVAPWMFER